MAFGRLLREANAEFNGKKASAKILVVSDFEHKCFNINFELIVSLTDQIKQLLGMENVKTAKEILEWIGILKGPLLTASAGALVPVTYLRYLKWKKGREVTEEYSDVDKSGMVKVSIKGDNNSVTVHPVVLALSKNPKALRATRDAFLPLGHDGFDTMRVADRDDEVMETFSPTEVNDIAASCARGIDESKEAGEPDVEVTPAWLSVYSPVYDLTASNWRFRLGREAIYADITETTIAQDALKRGGALSEDAYQVMLEVTTPFDAQGKEQKPTYKIKQVIRFVPGRTVSQPDLFKPD